MNEKIKINITVLKYLLKLCKNSPPPSFQTNMTRQIRRWLQPVARVLLPPVYIEFRR